MHLRLDFEGGFPAGYRALETRKAGFAAAALSSFSVLPRAGAQDSLLLGFGNLGMEEIRDGFERIGKYIEGLSG